MLKYSTVVSIYNSPYTTGLGGLLRQDNVDTFFWQFPVRHSANNDVNALSNEGVVREWFKNHPCTFSEQAIAPHSSTLAWRIPWTEEPGRLQPMLSQTVGHDWVTSFSLFTFMHWRRKQQPTPVFLPGESQGQGGWWAAVYGVAQSRTQLKWLSSLYFLCFWWHYQLIKLTMIWSFH